MAAFSLPSWLSRHIGPNRGQAWCRTALASETSLQASVETIVHQLRGAGPADLALVFAAASYASDLPRLLPLLQEKLRANHWIGCLGGGVVGTDATGTPHELEKKPALSVTLLRLPGALLQPFAIDTETLPDLDGPAEPWRALLNAAETTGGSPSPSMLLLVDPSCSRINDLISGLDYACPEAVKLGGIAGQHSAGHGSLLYGNQVVRGAVGCLIGGTWQLDPVVAQGCRPIGPVFDIEQAQRNVVLEVEDELLQRSAAAVAAGVEPSQLWWDPGLGFAKNKDQNLELLDGLQRLAAHGYPLLVGPSRKRFIGEILNEKRARARSWGTAAAVCKAIAAGASMVRVHDVAAMLQVCAMADALWPHSATASVADKFLQKQA